jgi:hypothetical protein
MNSVYTVREFCDALNMKEFPQLGYKLVKYEEGLFWEYHYLSEYFGKPNRGYPANEEARKNMHKLYAKGHYFVKKQT